MSGRAHSVQMCSASKVGAQLFNGLPQCEAVARPAVRCSKTMLGLCPLTCWAKGRTRSRAQMARCSADGGASHRRTPGGKPKRNCRVPFQEKPRRSFSFEILGNSRNQRGYGELLRLDCHSQAIVIRSLRRHVSNACDSNIREVLAQVARVE